MRCKRTVLYSQLLRAKRLGSVGQAQERGMTKIEALFRHNGYPNKLIQKTKHHILSNCKTGHSNVDQKQNQAKGDNTDTTCISLPYIDDTLARRVDGAARSSGLKARVAWVSGKILD